MRELDDIKATLNGRKDTIDRALHIARTCNIARREDADNEDGSTGKGTGRFTLVEFFNWKASQILRYFLSIQHIFRERVITGLLYGIKNKLSAQIQTIDDASCIISDLERQGLDAARTRLPAGKTQCARKEQYHSVITTLFLRECYAYLMKGSDESIAYISGIERNSFSILDQLIPFQMDRQSPAYVSGNIISSTEALVMLSNCGYGLLGTIHCHPGSGETSTYPSGIDTKHHKRLEEGGYTALGVIMTRDGHFRFYSDKMPFSVEVIGKDTIRLGENSYRLLLDFKTDE